MNSIYKKLIALPTVMPKIANADIVLLDAEILTPINENASPKVSLTKPSINCDIAIGVSLSELLRYPLNTPLNETNKMDGATLNIDNVAFLLPTKRASAGAHVILINVVTAPILANNTNALFKIKISFSPFSSVCLCSAKTRAKDFVTPAVQSI